MVTSFIGSEESAQPIMQGTVLPLYFPKQMSVRFEPADGGTRVTIAGAVPHVESTRSHPELWGEALHLVN